MAYPSILEDCCSWECYQMWWVWNRCVYPESHVLTWGNFSERLGSMLGWSEWNGVNLVYMAILSLVNTITQIQISQYNDSSYTNTKTLHPSWSLTSYTLQLQKLHCQMHPQTRYMHNLIQKPCLCTTVFSHEITVVDIPIHAEHYM